MARDINRDYCEEQPWARNHVRKSRNIPIGLVQSPRPHPQESVKINVASRADIYAMRDDKLIRHIVDRDSSAGANAESYTAFLPSTTYP